MKWISVKDRLPSGGDEFSSQLVLTWDKRRDAHFVSYYWKKAKHWHDLNSIITHWMPLPKPPKQ